MVTYADKSMQPQLVTLWRQSFGDSPDYIGMFLDWNFDRIKTIVYVTEDDASKPVSVAYLLPVTYAFESISYRRDFLLVFVRGCYFVGI